MSNYIPLEKILFLDIETVPQTYEYAKLDEKTKELFNAKNRFAQNEEKSFEMIYNEKGGILSEFGKIICISIGMIHKTTLGRSMRLKSFAHDDEETLLKQFKKLLDDHYNTNDHVLCGHNAKEFDFPYICRRMLINGITLPTCLDLGGKKPWEIKHIDTMEMWKFGDYKAYTSLSLLCHVFNIPTPKDEITGADDALGNYEEKDLDRIRIYCENDVIALIQLYLKMKGESLISDGNITSAGL